MMIVSIGSLGKIQTVLRDPKVNLKAQLVFRSVTAIINHRGKGSSCIETADDDRCAHAHATQTSWWGYGKGPKNRDPEGWKGGKLGEDPTREGKEMHSDPE